MKKATSVFVGLALSLALAASLVMAQANPRGEATFGGGKVAIDYGRPSAKGRDVMGMIKPGTFWRMGADTATTLKTEVPLMFGDATVPKGTYTLVAHFVEKDKWNLVVAKSVGSGNTPEEVAAEVPGKLETGQEQVEQMTIDLKENGDKGELVLTWTTYRLSVNFTIGS
jgi:hypothetical protein